jgi:hypothetical protein
MKEGRRVSRRAERFARRLKAHELFCGERIARRFISRGEVRHQAVHAQVSEIFERAGKLRRLNVARAEPPDARVNLRMNIRDDARLARRRIERLHHVESVDDGHEFVLETRARLPFPETFETEDRLLYSGTPQLDALFRQCDREPLRALRRQTPRALDRPVPVCVGLHDTHHARFAADEATHRAKVRGERIEIDLRPRRASRRRVNFLAGVSHRVFRILHLSSTAQPRLISDGSYSTRAAGVLRDMQNRTQPGSQT